MLFLFVYFTDGTDKMWVQFSSPHSLDQTTEFIIFQLIPMYYKTSEFIQITWLPTFELVSVTL
jgi:hypothetical protein